MLNVLNVATEEHVPTGQEDCCASKIAVQSTSKSVILIEPQTVEILKGT